MTNFVSSDIIMKKIMKLTKVIFPFISKIRILVFLKNNLIPKIKKKMIFLYLGNLSK